jgi:hypothetical protein
MAATKQPLSVTHPELAAQAVGWDPTTVLPGSGKRLTWKCPKGHRWNAIVMNRVRGTGCPVCSGRIAEIGVNDLATTNPELAAQADGWDPTTVSAFSHQKRDWICDLGHKWTARVAERSGGNGCPICSGRRVFRGFNDLATTHPELAAQADGWDPTTVVAGAGKKLVWKCKLGHQWIALIGNRTKGSGCPFCSGRVPTLGVTDLATTNPELAAQADGWDPTTVSRGSSQKLQWKCDLGHLWKASVAERSSGNGCPTCANKTIHIGFNDLATTHPELAAQADGWDPTTVVAGAGKKLVWKCKLGHQWKASVNNRSKGTSCPTCANKTIHIGFNDLATTSPELAAQADGWDPTTVVAFSNKKVQWKCEFGHQWSTTVASRSSGTGCPICTGRVAEIGVNDLGTTNPELAAQADGWDPTTVVAFSNKKVQWKCEFGHQWSTTVASRSSGTGCPVCSGHKVLQGYNDLATISPELAAQADGWDPTTVTSQTHKKVDWVCTTGHRWKATVKNRFRSTGCPICSNKQLLRGFNDLATTHPELAAQADGWDPATIIANTNKILSWRCPEGHQWLSSGNNRAQGKGCPSCAEFGFNPGKAGWLYFLFHDGLDLFQIGISNDLKSRLKKHSNKGWNVIEVRGPMDGFLTRELESAMIRAITKRGGQLAHNSGIPKFDGYSEAWLKDSLQVQSIKQLIEWVYEDDH